MVVSDKLCVDEHENSNLTTEDKLIHVCWRCYLYTNHTQQTYIHNLL